MYAAYPYDLSSTERVEETVTVADAKIFLRHIPKKNSIVIDGFTETQAAVVPQNHFRCDYEDEKSWYRDANRILYVNAAHNGQTLTVSYVAIGTVLTAAIWNEIKRHLDTPHAAQYTLPTASDEVKGGIKVGAGLCVNDDTLNCTVKGGNEFFRKVTPIPFGEDRPGYVTVIDSWRAKSWTIEQIDDSHWGGDAQNFVEGVGRPSQFGDLLYYTGYAGPDGPGGWAYRASDKWYNLGAQDVDGEAWDTINPLLTVEDRQKLDALNVEQLAATNDQICNRLDALEKNSAALTADAHKFSAAAKNLSDVADSALAILDTRIALLEHNFADLDNKFAKVDELSARLARLESALQDLLTALS